MKKTQNPKTENEQMEKCPICGKLVNKLDDYHNRCDECCEALNDAYYQDN